MDKWIINLEKKREKMQKYNQKEMPTFITYYYYYISTNNEIVKITCKKNRINNKITSGELLHTICENRITPSYVLDEILLFQQDKMSPLPLTMEDIEIEPSLFIYHDVNCIFFIYKQRQKTSHRTGNMSTFKFSW
jgi:hypothetical protein